MIYNNKIYDIKHFLKLLRNQSLLKNNSTVLQTVMTVCRGDTTDIKRNPRKNQIYLVVTKTRI